VGLFRPLVIGANAVRWSALLGAVAPAGPHRPVDLPCCPNAWSRSVGHFASRAQCRGRPHERGRARLVVDEAGGPAHQV